MSPAELIERVAEETEVEPADVERVLEVAVDSLASFIAAEDAGALDASTAAILRTVRELILHSHQPEKLIEALMPDRIALPTPAAVLQARRNVEARTELLEEFGGLRSDAIADLAGSRAANRAALANRWRAEERVVAVPVRDELLYPGFQFNSEGKPKPAVADIVTRLRSNAATTDWQAALWFTTPTGWLGGRRPVDLLDDDPEAVIEAAELEVSDFAG